MTVKIKFTYIYIYFFKEKYIYKEKPLKHALKHLDLKYSREKYPLIFLIKYEL